jgi:ankyrin repeat protein
MEPMALSDAAEAGDLALCKHLLAEASQMLARKATVADTAPLPVSKVTPSTALHEAAESGDVAKCRALLTAGADPFALDLGDYTPMDLAVMMSRLEVCRLFEECLPGISMTRLKDRETSLELAVKLGNREVVQLLVLECGADLNHRDVDGRSLVELADDNEYMVGLLHALHADLATRVAIGELDEPGTVGRSAAPAPI